LAPPFSTGQIGVCHFFGANTNGDVDEIVDERWIGGEWPLIDSLPRET
jgi:hypothetical protein